MVEDEQELTGGNASESVVRIGHTVRKPWMENSAAVQSYLGALRSSGVDVPQPLGRDADGRHVVEYIEGILALDQLPLGQDDLLRVGRMIRHIHDASEEVVIPNPDDWNMLLPAENPNLMCHNDLAPWNLIMGDRWVFIDWDGCGPSTRLWDLAYAAQSFGMLFAEQPVEDAALRFRAVVDGYEADDALRKALPARNGETNSGDVQSPEVLEPDRFPALGRHVRQWTRRALASRGSIRRTESSGLGAGPRVAGRK